MAWTHEQRHNAQVIIAVGKKLGASNRDIQIALMTALTESSLHNYTGGDRDSVGLFQQRAAWGSFDQRHDPAQSARMFFLGGHAGQRGLFDFHDRDNMTMGQAAQAVQVSAFPDRYAEHTHDAANLMQHYKVPLGPLGTVDFSLPDFSNATEHGAKDFQQNKAEAKDIFDPNFATQQGNGGPDYLKPAVEQTNSGTAGLGEYAAPTALSDLPRINDKAFRLPQVSGGNGIDSFSINHGNGGGMGGDQGEAWRQRVSTIARRYLGIPYVWGGTTPNGFDCSGFVQYVYKQMGVDLPRISYQQATSGHRIPLDKLRVGDLVAWNNSTRNPGADHIAIYIGHGRIIEAPHTGANVRVQQLYDQDIAWGVRMKRGRHA